MEKIAAAAIQFNNCAWTVPRPARHGDVLKFILDVHPSLDAVLGETQGFITTGGAWEGRFVDRFEARKIADAAGQIIASRIGPDGVPYKFQHSQLFSEDVW